MDRAWPIQPQVLHLSEELREREGVVPFPRSADDNTTLSVYIPQDRLAMRPIERLQALASKRDRSLNHLVVQAILEYLDIEENDGSGSRATDAPEHRHPGLCEGTTQSPLGEEPEKSSVRLCESSVALCVPFGSGSSGLAPRGRI